MCNTVLTIKFFKIFLQKYIKSWILSNNNKNFSTQNGTSYISTKDLLAI